jgi:uncharacterized protein (TIGR03066 family)
MKHLVAVVTALAIAAGAAAAPRKEAKPAAPTIVGTWKIVRSTDIVPVGTTVVFNADLTMKVSLDFNGKAIDIDGTYKVEGDKLIVTVRGPGGMEDSDTDTIKSLDARKLVLVDQDGKETELERK